MTPLPTSTQSTSPRAVTSSHPELFSSTGVIRLDTDRGLGRLADYRGKRAERNGWDPDVALDMLYTDRPEHLDLRPWRCAGSPRGR